MIKSSKISFFFFSIISSFCFSLSFSLSYDHQVSLKRNAECDAWAKEGKCSDDSNSYDDVAFMWTECLTSCVEFAQDEYEEACTTWANLERECSENPRFIQIKCPVSCGHAISWSPYKRNELNFDALEYHENIHKLEEKCPAPGNVLSAADLMAARLIALVNHGGYNSLPSLSSSSPSEYLFYHGLSEAIIYTLRLYDVVISSSAPAAAAAAHSGDIDDVYKREKSLEHRSRIDEVLKVMGSGWDADILSRSISKWIGYIQDSADVAHHTTKHYYSIKLMEELGINAETRTTPERKLLLEESCVPRFDNHMHDDLWNHFTLSHKKNQHQHKHGDDTINNNNNNNNDNNDKYKFNIATIEDTASALALGEITETVTEVKLSNGVTMPLLGLGTWQLEGEICEKAVFNAISIGYRHIDSAQAYRNEENVGNAITAAIESSIIIREELFIATKISDENDGGYDGTIRLVEKQMKLLQVDYIDLYMLHSPMEDSKKQEQTWKALEDLYDKGVIRSLGISNFNSKDLLSLLSSPTRRYAPQVIQNKLDVYHVGKQLDNIGDDVVALAKGKGIVIVGYSPFSAYPFSMVPLYDPIVGHIAARISHSQNQNLNRNQNQGHTLSNNSNEIKSKVTPAQVLLKWALQNGIAVIPRSQDIDRLKENFHVLKMSALSKEEMEMMTLLQFLVSSPNSVAV